jgi:hypothetical protein
MPRHGFRSVSLKEKVYEELDALSTKNHRSIAQTIEHLLEICVEA